MCHGETANVRGPGVTAHIVQRGNSRLPCFFTPADYRYYLEPLANAIEHSGCRIHAYMLLTNHVYLLLTLETSPSPSLTLQFVGRRSVRCVDRSYRRSGTFWEGGFRLALIDSERYHLICSRYLDPNPLRANIVIATTL